MRNPQDYTGDTQDLARAIQEHRAELEELAARVLRLEVAAGIAHQDEDDGEDEDQDDDTSRSGFVPWGG